MEIIGRRKEQRELQRLCDSPRPEFAVVYGRRRVGKTYLVREYFSNAFAFHASGVAGGNAKVQLASFSDSLADCGVKERARDWFEAFRLLRSLLHLDQIHAALGVSGVAYDASSWRNTKSDPGAQVDLVLDRSDGIINLLEMRFARTPYEITKDYDAALRYKAACFARETGTRKALHLTLVSPYGAKRNAYSGNLQSEVSAEDLFA